MTIAIWLTVVSICLLGAMSPGPSLAVVLQQTLKGGRKNGLVAALTHGSGIGLYALLCISGIALMITTSPLLFTGLQWLGSAYLLWLGIKGLRAKAGNDDALTAPPTTGSAARDGFLVVFLNPKVAVFFIALFSQVIGSQSVSQRSQSAQSVSKSASQSVSNKPATAAGGWTFIAGCRCTPVETKSYFSQSVSQSVSESVSQ